MATAVADGVIAEQPCRIKGAGAPQQTLGRVLYVSDRLLSPTQVAAVVDAMPANFPILVLAAAWSGLRQRELLALTRADIGTCSTRATAVLATAASRMPLRASLAGSCIDMSSVP